MASAARLNFRRKRRQLERGLGVRRHCVERGNEFLLRIALVTLRLEQQRELKANDGEIGVELEGVAIRADGALIVAERSRDVADLLMNLGAHRRDTTRCFERRQRRPRLTGVGARRREQHQDVDVLRSFSSARRSANGRASCWTTEANERPGFADTRRTRLRIERKRLAISFERLAEQPLPSKDLSVEHQAVGAAIAACERAADLGRCAIVQPLRQKVRRHCEGRRVHVARRRRRGRRRHGGQLGEQRVEQRRIEVEVGDRGVSRTLAAEIRLDREVRILVLDIHRQLELLRHVVRDRARGRVWFRAVRPRSRPNSRA